MLCERIPRPSTLLCFSRNYRSKAPKTTELSHALEKDKEENFRKSKAKFSKLVLWGANQSRPPLRQRRIIPKTEYQPFPVPKNWTTVWPTAHSSSNILPLPIRQGHVKNAQENSGIVPDRFCNSELIKIPNFLHLTPVHIKKHCEALKPFLTAWPSGLQSPEDIRQHYPVEVVFREFVFSGPSMRDDRARSVALRLPVSRLCLDPRQLEKLRALAGPDQLERDEAGAEVLVLRSERCPTRKQNYDFLRYVLTALTAESKKLHAWESELTEDDWNIFRWEGSTSEKTMRSLAKDLPHDEEAIERYKKAVTDLRNSKEALEQLEEYKDSVKQLLGLQSANS